MGNPKTLFDKIWASHVINQQEDGTCLIYIDRHLVHEVTSPQAFEGLRDAGRKVRHPELTLAVPDHNVPTTDRSDGIKEEEGSLLENTSVILTSNLGNASSHDNRNMPVLFGGGGFKHGQHLAFDQKNNYPLPNLFLSVLQQSGLEVDQFATSTGTMRGLEVA